MNKRKRQYLYQYKLKNADAEYLFQMFSGVEFSELCNLDLLRLLSSYRRAVEFYPDRYSMEDKYIVAVKEELGKREHVPSRIKTIANSSCRAGEYLATIYFKQRKQHNIK